MVKKKSAKKSYKSDCEELVTIIYDEEECDFVLPINREDIENYYNISSFSLQNNQGAIIGINRLRNGGVYEIVSAIPNELRTKKVKPPSDFARLTSIISSKKLLRNKKKVRSLLLDEEENLLVYFGSDVSEDLETDWIRFQDRLKYNSLSYVDVGGRGNCLFHCLAAIIYDDKNDHSIVRKEIVEYIKENAEHYKNFIHGSPFSTYTFRMSRDGTWGDHVTLDAASNLYQLELIIVESHENYEITHLTPASKKANRTSLLGHIGEYHYVLVLPTTSEEELIHMTQELSITRSKHEIVEWVDYLRYNSSVDQEISRLKRLSQSYILDWDYYMKQSYFPVDSLRKYFDQVNSRKKLFCTKLPESDIPNGDLSFASLSTIGIQINQPMTTKHSYMIYWFKLLTSFTHLQTYQNNKNVSELLLTGTVLCHLFDSFWLNYCQNQNTGIILRWCRGTDIRWACPSLPSGWIVKSDGYLVAVIKGKPCILAIFEDKATSKQRDEDHCKIAETSRYAIDSLRRFNLSWEELQQIIIPTVHTAGQDIDYYLTSWLYVPDHFYIFQEAASYSIESVSSLIEAAQRLWNIVGIIENNIKVISSATDSSPHRYVERPRLESSPPTYSDSTRQDPSSGNDKGTTNTPTKYNSAIKRQLMNVVEDLGYNIQKEIHSSSITIVARAVHYKDQKVIKIVSRNSTELSILQQIGGKHHIIQLCRAIPINFTANDNSGQFQEFILLEFPYIENRSIETEEELRKFFYQLVDTMNFLHNQGIFYRDFKRDNILWDGQQLTLIDFNCSMFYKSNADYPSKENVGTKGYKAPEVEDSNKTSDIRADIYSIGKLLVYEWVKLQGCASANGIFDTPYEELLRDLKLIFKAPHDVYSLAASLIHPDPSKRLSGQNILQQSFLGNATKSHIKISF